MTIMDEFFKNVPLEAAIDIEQAAKAIYELREHRAAILANFNVDDEADLLDLLSCGDLPEHPAYEQFLSASILRATRNTLRRQLANTLSQYSGAQAALGDGAEFEFSPVCLKPLIEQVCQDHVTGEISVMQDALQFKMNNGVTVELRVLSKRHYCFSWLWGDALLRIDTAPVSGATGSHFHDINGTRRQDPITILGDEPLANICRLIAALTENPTLDD